MCVRVWGLKFKVVDFITHTPSGCPFFFGHSKLTRLMASRSFLGPSIKWVGKSRGFRHGKPAKTLFGLTDQGTNDPSNRLGFSLSQFPFSRFPFPDFLSVFSSFSCHFDKAESLSGLKDFDDPINSCSTTGRKKMLPHALLVYFSCQGKAKKGRRAGKKTK